jgi:hypothetical protein
LSSKLTSWSEDETLLSRTSKSLDDLEKCLAIEFRIKKEGSWRDAR